MRISPKKTVAATSALLVALTLTACSSDVKDDISDPTEERPSVSVTVPSEESPEPSMESSPETLETPETTREVPDNPLFPSDPNVETGASPRRNIRIDVTQNTPAGPRNGQARRTPRTPLPHSINISGAGTPVAPKREIPITLPEIIAGNTTPVVPAQPETKPDTTIAADGSREGNKSPRDSRRKSLNGTAKSRPSHTVPVDTFIPYRPEAPKTTDSQVAPDKVVNEAEPELKSVLRFSGFDEQVVIIDVTFPTSIYAENDSHSRIIGKAKSGAAFVATVMPGGTWLRIEGDNSAGYVPVTPYTLIRMGSSVQNG